MRTRKALLERLQGIKTKRIPKSRRTTANSSKKTEGNRVFWIKSRNSTSADYPYRPHRSPTSTYRTPENKEGGIEPGE